MSEVINKHSRVPRGDNQIEPMKREKLTRGQLANLIGGKNPLANADPQKALLRYLADESTLDIALSYGVSRSGLNKWLRSVAEEEWLEAQCARAIARKEKAEDALEAATNATEIARAEKVLKGAQWELEKVNRRIYGQETMNINLNINADLGDRLRRARERTINVSTPQTGHLAGARVEDAQLVESQESQVQPQQSTAAMAETDACST